MNVFSCSKGQWKESHWRSTLRVNCWFVGWFKFTVWIALWVSDIQFAQNVRLLKHTLLNKLRCTAKLWACCLLNIAIPTTTVTSNYICQLCFLPPLSQPLPLYLNFNSDKQQITHKALHSDVLHTARHSGRFALQLPQQPVFHQHRSVAFFIQHV